MPDFLTPERKKNQFFRKLDSEKNTNFKVSNNNKVICAWYLSSWYLFAGPYYIRPMEEQAEQN